MSLTGIGAIAGVPLALAGAGVGAAGGITVGGSIIGETVAKNKQLQDAAKYLKADHSNSMQLRIIIGRAAKDRKFANEINFPVQDAANMLTMLGHLAKAATTSAALAKAIAAGAARGVATAGLHVAGLAISAVLIPFDLIQLIISSVKIHRKDKSRVVKEIEELADHLEDELLKLLKEKNYQLLEVKIPDDGNQEHSLLIAVNGSSLEEINADPNFSFRNIHANQVVIADCIGREIDPVIVQRVIKYLTWTGNGGKEKKMK